MRGVGGGGANIHINVRTNSLRLVLSITVLHRLQLISTCSNAANTIGLTQLVASSLVATATTYSVLHLHYS